MSRVHTTLIAVVLSLAAGHAFAATCGKDVKHEGACCNSKKTTLSKIDEAEVKFAVNTAFAIEHGKFDGNLTPQARKDLEIQTADLSNAIKSRGKFDPATAGKLDDKTCGDSKECGDCCGHEGHSKHDGVTKVMEGGCSNHKKGST